MRTYYLYLNNDLIAQTEARNFKEAKQKFNVWMKQQPTYVEICSNPDGNFVNLFGCEIYC